MTKNGYSGCSSSLYLEKGLWHMPVVPLPDGIAGLNPRFIRDLWQRKATPSLFSTVICP